MKPDKFNRAIYAGSFDPPTNGHLWLINQSCAMFAEVVIAIGINPDKKCSYSMAERISMLKQITQQHSNVVITSFENMYLVEYAHSIKADYILRGIRSVADYEYERSMRYINSDIYADILTLFFIPPREYSEVSSTLVKGLIGFENWEHIIQKYVPDAVRQIMIEKYYQLATD